MFSLEVEMKNWFMSRTTAFIDVQNDYFPFWIPKKLQHIQVATVIPTGPLCSKLLEQISWDLRAGKCEKFSNLET